MGPFLFCAVPRLRAMRSAIGRWRSCAAPSAGWRRGAAGAGTAPRRLHQRWRWLSLRGMVSRLSLRLPEVPLWSYAPVPDVPLWPVAPLPDVPVPVAPVPDVPVPEVPDPVAPLMPEVPDVPVPDVPDVPEPPVPPDVPGVAAPAPGWVLFCGVVVVPLSGVPPGVAGAVAAGVVVVSDGVVVAGDVAAGVAPVSVWPVVSLLRFLHPPSVQAASRAPSNRE